MPINLEISFKVVFKYLLPYPLRRDRMVDWLGSMLAGLQTVNGYFAAWAAGVRYALRFNGQVQYLEHVLNDGYDLSLRRIYIDDPAGQQIIVPYIHNRIEQQPPRYLFNAADAVPLLSNIVLKNTAELGTTVDFIVHVPVGIYDPTVELGLRKIIEKYRIAGKRYSFQTF